MLTSPPSAAGVSESDGLGHCLSLDLEFSGKCVFAKPPRESPSPLFLQPQQLTLLISPLSRGDDDTLHSFIQSFVPPGKVGGSLPSHTMVANERESADNGLLAPDPQVFHGCGQVML